jgi:hypothetical protein
LPNPLYPTRILVGHCYGQNELYTNVKINHPKQ